MTCSSNIKHTELLAQEHGRIRQLILGKFALKQIYLQAYSEYQVCIAKCGKQGALLELGAGLGFAKEMIPELLISDVVQYPGVEKIVDATKMDFADASLRFIGMLNVFHHIPDVEAFFHEAKRCLVPGGRVLIMDEHVGPLSTPILKYVHHEPFNKDATSWHFDSKDPLMDANGALSWIVFKRDYEIFQSKFPDFKLVSYKAHTPLMYWLAGGLKNWKLVDRKLFPVAKWLDDLLIRIWPGLGCFNTIELVKL